MKIESSILSLMTPRTRKAPSTAEEGLGVLSSPPARTPSVRSDAQRIDDFYARMSKQQLDWSDANKDGKVTKDEYMDGQKRLAEMNDQEFDSARSNAHWAKLDPDGKGALDANELQDGLEKLLPVGVGRLDANFAERLRRRQTSD
ncbi:EF-hand domain-containing protein [Rhizobium sp. GN54]|uniref:EF-hand domain-containing protein n=1 Tax=Rhizobium sp. GN54 TaxID=2898150 RepID=UPI001E29CEF2|nr:EF-hand domain-containing protein [Rhizobium sp. GN54]MCD2183703.1 EF-hand domain-containing protein [Rhizobium sp. GN54]